jgi:hypothetical protein
VAASITWQDDRVPHPGQPIATTRRTFLRGLLGATSAGTVAALSGCDIFAATNSPPPAEPVPPELAGFLAATTALGDRYDATLAAVNALPATVGQIRDAHRAHAVALAKAIGAPTPTASPGGAGPSGAPSAPTDRDQALAALVTAEKAAHDAAVTECLASSPRYAALLGSIAAARQTHLVGLA